MNGAEMICINDNVYCCSVLTPEYWTVPGNVNFNFTGLENQGSFSDFQWSVGQTPGVADTIPVQTRSDSTQKFFTYQTGLLVRTFSSWHKVTGQVVCKDMHAGNLKNSIITQAMAVKFIVSPNSSQVFQIMQGFTNDLTTSLLCAY